MVEDLIRIDEHWYVLATSSRADDRTRVLKHGDTFGLSDRYGDIQPVGSGELGLFHEGTRFLSRFELTLSGRRPMLLNSSVSERNELLRVDLTTPDIYRGQELLLAKGTLHLFRARLLWEGVLYEHLRLSNFGETAVNTELALALEADYRDIFEVRGHPRPARGQALPAETAERELTLGYRGLDGTVRRSRIRFSTTPSALQADGARFALEVPAHGHRELFISVACERDGRRPEPVEYTAALQAAQTAIRHGAGAQAEAVSSNEQFNAWLQRSAADLQMLITRTEHGPYPYAGVPWFSTAFGRDGIITALQCLWWRPEMARGVLTYLAATQAEEANPAQDAEPGKILHETRKGEMAALGEVPFGQYYGTVDATPLFVALAGAYYRRTAHRELIERIWPNIERALSWIDDYGDADNDGFVEYARHSRNGLVQQGWKDSDDSVFHADGRMAEPPIALAEVQGYVYDAKRSAAMLARVLGAEGRARELEEQAERLKRRFNEAFWCEAIGSYALALDGRKRPCAVPSSNAGQALLSGIAEPRLARRVADTLLSEDGFSGWGVRTIARSASRYNPMSYHNGSIWPHDNSMIAAGLARYGLKEQALRVMTGLFDASLQVEINRLPELFCGFQRLPGQGPTLYPVACLPQAWASGSVFHLLEACLGMSFDASRPQLSFDNPHLPPYIRWLNINGLQVGNAVVDLALRRHPRHVAVNVQRKQGDLEIIVRV